MTRLYIKGFSCIEEADFQFTKIAILIGPQASGKSIISKLVYFFYEVLSQQFQSIEDQKSLEAFRIDVSDEFCKWFPPSAWGRRKFVIRFEAPPYSIYLTRSNAKKVGRNPLRVQFSKYFEAEYISLLKGANSKRPKGKLDDLDFGREDEFFRRMRSAAERKLKKDMGAEFSEFQLFIPAGRSFFTSFGKAIAAFQGGILDPVTVRFGKFYATIRERNFYRSKEFGARMGFHPRFLMARFFGGRLTSDRDQEFLLSEDGRKIPLAMLSSGQQELLPLILAIDRVRFRERDILYIEEPEAHLFPTAQSQLIQYLALLVNSARHKRMLITTHSPYVLSKINVLAKAGAISKRRPRLNMLVDKILPRNSWVKPGTLAAYAIVKGKLVSILGSDGLLDGDYLDEISGELSREFSSLLDIENS